MLHIYEKVTATNLPNYSTAHCQLPSNFQFKESEALIQNPEDATTVDCLKFGFPVGYQGLIPTPTVTNHSSVIHHPGDITAFITK